MGEEDRTLQINYKAQMYAYDRAEVKSLPEYLRCTSAAGRTEH